MGFLTGPREVTALLQGLGPQSARAGAAKSLSASTASRASHLCTNKPQPTTGCAISIKAETVKIVLIAYMLLWHKVIKSSFGKWAGGMLKIVLTKHETDKRPYMD